MKVAPSQNFYEMLFGGKSGPGLDIAECLLLTQSGRQ